LTLVDNSRRHAVVDKIGIIGSELAPLLFVGASVVVFERLCRVAVVLIEALPEVFGDTVDVFLGIEDVFDA
jgi:hypothetical protein